MLHCFIVETIMIKFELNKGGKRIKLEPALKKLEKIISKEFGRDGIISIAIIDSKTSRRLNKSYRGKNRPADVLSFSFEDKDDNIGEIVLSYEEMSQRAKEEKKSLSRVATSLIIHGVCHIFGYSHKEEKDAIKMEKKEKKLLEKTLS